MIRVRLAGLADLSAIVALGARLHVLTNYADFQYNAVIARRMAKAAMTDKDSRVWVSVRDGEIVGFLVGMIGPMLQTHYMAATDQSFAAEAGGDLLLDAFIGWCKLRGVARIDMGISAGARNEKALRRLFQRKGFEYAGPMFCMNLLPGEERVGHQETA